MAVIRNSYYYFGPDLNSCFFKPVKSCYHQWKNLTSPFESNKNLLKETIKRVLLAIPLTIATLAACLVTLPGFLVLKASVTTINDGSKYSQGSGRIEKQKVELSQALIRAVELQGIGNLAITFTDQEQYLEKSGDDNLLDYLISRVDDERLVIDIKNGVEIQTSNPITYHLYMPHRELKNLSISGCGHIEIERLEADELSCIISGQGNMKIKSGDIQKQEIIISGQGHYDASDCKSQNTTVTISGQGAALIQASEILRVNISGIGDCFYKGQPQIHRAISGLGRVTKLRA